MNEGDSAGGGQQGLSPAPPAVPDRRSTLLPTIITTTTTTVTQSVTIITTTSSPLSISNPISTTTPSSSYATFSSKNFRQNQSSSGSAAQTSHSNNSSLTQHMLHTTQSRFVSESGISLSNAQHSLISDINLQKEQQPNTSQLSGRNIGIPRISGELKSANVSAAADSSKLVVERPLSPAQFPLSKRLKIDSSLTECTAGSLLPVPNEPAVLAATFSTSSATIVNDINALKKRILEHKYLRLKSLKEKFSENVAELFYLQSGGNMMEYPTWRNKPPSPQFISFTNSNRLDQLVNDDRVATNTTGVPLSTSTQPIVSIPSVVPKSPNPLGLAADTANSQVNLAVSTVNVPSIIVTTTASSVNVNSNVATTSSSQTTTIGINKSHQSSIINAGAVKLSGSIAANQSIIKSSASNVSIEGTEIKIPAVGATPVATSTTLPAAVVQLTQQGGTPLLPNIGGGVVVGSTNSGSCSQNLLESKRRRLSTTSSTVGNAGVSTSNTVSSATTTQSAHNTCTIAEKIPNASPAPSPLTKSTSDYLPELNTEVANIQPQSSCNDSSLIGGGNGNGSCGSQEFSFKAKQEVYVMQRVSELQREGLWTEKRLPKVQEPNRPKAHWDYLLEEMVWLAADFAQERKWKKSAAKKCARMVQKYFQDKANAAQKAEKAHELHLKRIAAFISKEVKMFWSNVEKLVEYKHHAKLEEKRKKALDQHLSFIVDQTEKFSQQLAEGMNKSLMDTKTTASTVQDKNSIESSPSKRQNASDDEFRPTDGSDDDEETIAKAEEEEADVNEEVAALEKESQMDLDDFLKGLPKDYLENRDKILQEEESAMNDGDGSNTDEDDREFEANEASTDDENTISQEEAAELDVDHKKELDELTADNEMSVEKLLEKYTSGKIADDSSKMEIDSDDDENPVDEEKRCDSEDMSAEDEEEEAGDDESNESSEEDESGSDEESEDDSTMSDKDVQADEGLKSLLEDTDANKDDMIKDAAALAESIQPKGNTLSSTNVVTPVPFLLKHSLREYQHIGLDWLVTMHDRKLNGILADEMGLGKTIQTIALLAHLACVKGNWGPHLIVVPSSVMLNWEMEFKKWCPGFKILTYYGAQKERKLKRVGWTKPNAFHVCITSYKLVVQDQQSFRRKKWKYLILDEAQNIKNFKSQRWQLLLNFSTERRLLLTGTPLQNDLMELWSLMHFLMPYVFQSHREFKEWFSNPMTGMIEGNCEYNESLISRLHKVIRPFLLRRLKKEVEKQMPKKYEHVVMCRLSNRQRYLYDDFMSRAKTRETLQTGSLLNVINVLMQLRKVCNHPNLFEVRPTISPFQMEGISFHTARLVCSLMEYDPFTQIDLNALNLLLINLETTITAYVSHKSRILAPPRKLIEEIDSLPEPPPRCPNGKFKFYIRIRDNSVQENLIKHNSNLVKVGSSPAMKTEGNKLVPVFNLDSKFRKLNSINPINPIKSSLPPATSSTTTESSFNTTHTPISFNSISSQKTMGVVTPKNATNITANFQDSSPSSQTKIAKIVHSGKPYFVLTPSTSETGNRFTLVCKNGSNLIPSTNTNTICSPSASGGKLKSSVIESPKSQSIATNKGLIKTLAQQVKSTAEHQTKQSTVEKMEIDENQSTIDSIFHMTEIIQKRKESRQERLSLMARINRRRCQATPIYGEDCRCSLADFCKPARKLQYSQWHTRSYTNCQTAMRRQDDWMLTKMIKSYEQRTEEMRKDFNNFVIYVPPVAAPQPRFYVQNLTSSQIVQAKNLENNLSREISPKLTLLHPIISAMNTQFPDPRLIQYDCGKLQTLDRLLRTLKSGQHRVLIFTQMTKMLDVLEAFLNYHGHIYLRLDGSTRVEQRQILMERFNGDKRIFAFILSTRSGGVGINLTGADTVIFYDSDWNPTMDAQAQDRCHRIGQTRDVHIYRLISEKTIEVNILKKANQKRMLSDMAIEGGNFTTTYFKSSTIKDLFNIEQQESSSTTTGGDSNSTNIAKSSSSTIDKTKQPSEVEKQVGSSTLLENEKQSLRAFEQALANVEDELDVQAAKVARAEAAADLEEFDETIPLEEIADKPSQEMSKVDQEVENLVKQLTPVERYAMRFVEETGAAWSAEQLRAAEAEIEAKKREWEANRLAALQKEEEMLKAEADDDELLTYDRKDANNQVITKNISPKNRNLNRNRNNKSRGGNKSTIKNNSIKKTNCSLSGEVAIAGGKNRNENVTKFSGSGRRGSRRSVGDGNRGKKRSFSSIASENSPNKGDKKNISLSKSCHVSPNKRQILTESPKLPVSRTGVKNQKLLSIKLKRKMAASKMMRNGSVVTKKKKIVHEESNQKKRRFRRKTDGACDVDENSENELANDDTEPNDTSDEKDDIEDSETTSEVKEKPKIKQMTKKTRKSVAAGEESDYDENADTSSQAGSQDKGTTRADSNSIDVWNQDTTTTNSTYYNVSEEEESEASLFYDDNYDKASQNKTLTNSKTTKPTNKIISTPVQENRVDVNSPRTRSSGTVKINLWTLDVSPVLPGVKPVGVTKSSNRQSNKDSSDESQSESDPNENDDDSTTITENNKEDVEESKDDEQQEGKETDKIRQIKRILSKKTVKTPKTFLKRRKIVKNMKNKNVRKLSATVETQMPSSSSSSTKADKTKPQTLHRWLLKSPKVVLTQIGLDNLSPTSSNSSSAALTAVDPLYIDSAGDEHGPS